MHSPTFRDAQGWVKHCDWFTEIDSTSDHARRYCAIDSTNLPALFVADLQTTGRGRSANRWWSPHGCLMMTLALGEEELPQAPSARAALSLVSGVAIAQAIENLAPGISVQLKWPNDIYVREKKLGGILIESIVSGAAAGRAVWLVGIGVNVNVDWESASAELRSKAICMATAGASNLSREHVLTEILHELRTWLGNWRAGNSDWFAQWNSRSLLTDRLVRVRVPAEPELVGRCQGIDQQGRLICQSELGLYALTTAEILDWSDRFT